MNISGGESGNDYIVTPVSTVNSMLQFKKTIQMLRDSYGGKESFFYYYLITTLSDYNIIEVNDIFTLSDRYLITFYINQIINYYERFINATAEEHKNRIIKEFNVNDNLKLALKSITDESDNNTMLDNLNNNVITDVGFDFKYTPCDVELTNDIKNFNFGSKNNTFQYINNLLSFITIVNEQYTDFFNTFDSNTQYNVNSIYSIVKKRAQFEL